MALNLMDIKFHFSSNKKKNLLTKHIMYFECK